MLSRIEPSDAGKKNRAVLSKPWKVSLVGFGSYAEKGHLPAYLGTPSFELKAVADPVAERRQAAQRMAPGIAVYQSLDDMLSDPAAAADIVDICSPPALHFTQARAALLAGKHVFCEKPVVPRVELLRSLSILAHRKRRHLLAGHNYSFSPAIRRFVDLAKSQCIGAATRLQIDILRTGPAQGTPEWRPGWRREPAYAKGGIMMDHGPHALSLALRLAEQPPLEISACMAGTGADGTEEIAAIALAFRRLETYITLSWRAQERRTEYRITGTDGQLSLHDYSTLVLRQRRRAPTIETFPHSDPPLWTQSMLSAHGLALSAGTSDALSAELWQVTEALELAHESSRAGGRWRAFRGTPENPGGPAVRQSRSGGSVAR